MSSAPELRKAAEAGLKARKKVIEEKKERPNKPFDCLGHQVLYAPYYTDHRTDRTLVAIDGVEIAMEWVHHPWSFLKEVTFRHWVWVNVATRDRAQQILDLAGVTGTVEADPYAEPERFHVWVGGDVEDVVKVWKIVRPDYIKEHG